MLQAEQIIIQITLLTQITQATLLIPAEFDVSMLLTTQCFSPFIVKDTWDVARECGLKKMDPKS